MFLCIKRRVAHYHMSLFHFWSPFIATMWNQNNFFSTAFVFSSHFTCQTYFLKHRILGKYTADPMWHITSMYIYYFQIYKTRIIIMSSCRTLSGIIFNNACKSTLKIIKHHANVKYYFLTISYSLWKKNYQKNKISNLPISQILILVIK